MSDARDTGEAPREGLALDVPRVLGETDLAFETARAEELRRVLLELAQQARRTIDLVSRHLDPPLCDREDFVDAVKRLVLGSTRARVRILVMDPAPLVGHGHRLLPLVQRLSSYIELRVPGPEHRELNEAWLVADNDGYAHRRFSDRYEATCNFHDPRYATLLSNRFEELWQRAQADPNLRRLHL
ncbi:MAG TPA: hypothetical protein PJ986_17740 [Gammaproteobacteria bacterium]|nr:hypothetical protein [Gammaproteobacteria bacterium]